MFRVTSVPWPEAEQLLWRTAFRVFASRRALASLLLALERRRIAHPKVKDYANFQVGLQQGFTTGGMGSGRHFAQQRSSRPNVRFGSKADIATRLTNVRFAPESGHRKEARFSANQGRAGGASGDPADGAVGQFTRVKWVREGTAGSQSKIWPHWRRLVFSISSAQSLGLKPHPSSRPGSPPACTGPRTRSRRLPSAAAREGRPVRTSPRNPRTFH